MSHSTGRIRLGRTWHRAAAFGVLLLTFPAFAPAQRKADLSRLVFVGDSLTAGFQNNSLLSTQQVHGYAALLARQAGAPLVLPLIAPPGIPNVLILNPDGSVGPAPGVSPGLLPGPREFTNLAIPGARVIDTYMRHPVFGSGEELANLILGPAAGPTDPTQVSRALALNPTTIVAWVGNNDVLLSPLYWGSTIGITDPASFAIHYAQMLWHLEKSNATIVLATIPDVLDTPVFVPIAAVAGGAGIPVPLACTALGQSPQCAGSYITAFGLPAVQAILQRFAQTQAPGTLPGYFVITPAEAAVVRETVEAYNRTIADLARTHGAVLVDVNSLFDDLQANGVVVNGQRLTTALGGGLFSLDAVHPTNTGYALIANEFIRALNREAAAGIPPVSVTAVRMSDPLVPPPAAAAAAGR